MSVAAPHAPRGIVSRGFVAQVALQEHQKALKGLSDCRLFVDMA